MMYHVQSGENGIFLTNKLLNQLEISGGKVEFQYLIRKLLVLPVLLAETVCVPGQIHFISSDFLFLFGLFSFPFPLSILLDESLAMLGLRGIVPQQ